MRKTTIPVLEPVFGGNEKAYVTECLDTGWVSSKGQFVERFESMFSALHCDLSSVSTSSGTTALHLALVAMQVGQGDEVIVPNFTFASTVNAVLFCGATPVLADVDPQSWNITTEIIESLITRTKAIIPVHIYGQPCDMAPLVQLAKKHGLLLIEDSAEALGSSYQGQPVGTFGDASIFSFFGNKTITTGEGGMVLFKDAEIAAKARILRNVGMRAGKRYWHEVVGYNYRLTNIQAAIGVAQLEKLSSLVEAKQHVAARYKLGFSGLNIIIQETMLIASSSYWVFGVIINGTELQRDKLIKFMSEKGIETRPFFYPMHLQPPYKNLPSSASLENSVMIGQKGVCLPSSPSLREVDQAYVIKQFIKGL